VYANLRHKRSGLPAARRLNRGKFRVAWFNHERLHSCVGYIPPAEAEHNQLGKPVDEAALL
jgi:transposase InsO family protein